MKYLIAKQILQNEAKTHQWKVGLYYREEHRSQNSKGHVLRNK